MVFFYIQEKVNRCTARSSTSLFDDVAVDDPRVYDLCVHSGDFLPYELLSECLKRLRSLKYLLLILQ